MQVDTKYGTIDIAISGLRGQNKQMEYIGSNIANVNTTDNGRGEPYKRIEAMFKQAADGLGGVQVEKADSKAGYKTVLDPANPAANEKGYVKMPDINLPAELMKLNAASRAYEANTAVLKRYQKMVEQTLQLLK
jgi:flagellar basal-body rod protein FlgC